MCEPPNSRFVFFGSKIKRSRRPVSPWKSPPGSMAPDHSRRHNTSGMRKAVAVCLVLLCWGTSLRLRRGPGGPPQSTAMVSHSRVPTTGLSGFSLTGRTEHIIPVIVATLDPHSIGGAMTAGLAPEIEAASRKTIRLLRCPYRSSWDAQMGDLFSTLHEQYAWRTKFKSLTLGAGIYRDIPIYKALRIQPYVGVVRTRALLRPSDLGGNSVSYEYRLTAFCVGLPLVCGF